MRSRGTAITLKEDKTLHLLSPNSFGFASPSFTVGAASVGKRSLATDAHVMIAWARRCRRNLLIALPFSLFFFVLADVRLWGLGLGLGVLIFGRLLRQNLKLPDWVELAFLSAAGFVAYAFGFRIQFLTKPEGGFFYLTALSLPLTIAWIVAVAQSVNFLGRVDSTGKLLGKTVLLTGFAFLLTDLLQSQVPAFALVLVLAILGLTLALMIHRIHFAISGVGQCLSFGLALVSISGLLKTTASLALLTPLAIFGLPMVTTSLAFAAGRAPMQHGWLDFFTTRGFSVTAALFLIYLASSLLSLSLVLTAQLNTLAFISCFALLIVSGTVLVFGKDRWLAGGLESDEKKLKLFGTSVDRVTLDEASDKLETLVRSGYGAMIITPDTTALMRAQRDAKLRKIYESAALVTPDGSGLVLASKLLGMSLKERVSGIDLLVRFFPCAAAKGYKIFLLGSAPGVAEEAALKLEKRFKKLKIVGTHHGYFSAKENDAVIEKIRQTQPDLILVALGVPRQEHWMSENQEALGVPALMGVGGSLDVFAGRVKRAPELWQKLGLEWAYRVLKQPWRLWRVRVLPIFLSKVLLLKLVKALV